MSVLADSVLVCSQIALKLPKSPRLRKFRFPIFGRYSLAKRMITGITLSVLLWSPVIAGDAPQTGSKKNGERKVKRILLLGQKPDGHARSTHEYSPGMRLLAKLLQGQQGLQTILVSADEPWKQGPELIDGADAVVIFLSEGGKWIHQDAARLAALKKLASRGGGFVGLHWGIGTRKAEYIAEYLNLVGGCHGGPDRKYKVVDVTTRIARPYHPIMRGIRPIAVHEEFYYTLKFVKPGDSVVPLLRVPIDGKPHTVAWAWERPDGGRSFGFSGCHFHKNWERVEYRRMVTQAVLWTLKRRIPKNGLAVKVKPQDLALPPKK